MPRDFLNVFSFYKYSLVILLSYLIALGANDFQIYFSYLDYFTKLHFFQQPNSHQHFNFWHIKIHNWAPKLTLPSICSISVKLLHPSSCMSKNEQKKKTTWSHPSYLTFHIPSVSQCDWLLLQNIPRIQSLLLIFTTITWTKPTSFLTWITAVTISN